MFEQKDLIHLKNLQRLLAKSKMELEGAEILAAADVLRWVGFLEQKVTKHLETQRTLALAQAQAPSPPIVEPVITVHDQSEPLKEEKPKKSRKKDVGNTG